MQGPVTNIEADARLNQQRAAWYDTIMARHPETAPDTQRIPTKRCVQTATHVGHGTKWLNQCGEVLVQAIHPQQVHRYSMLKPNWRDSCICTQSRPLPCCCPNFTAPVNNIPPTLERCQTPARLQVTWASVRMQPLQCHQVAHLCCHCACVPIRRAAIGTCPLNNF